MLIVTAQQVSNNGNDICDYDVHVYVNKREIWTAKVRGHNRADGFSELLQRIAETVDGRRSP